MQRTSFTTATGLTIALSPDTYYELTIFSPAARTLGSTFFRSNASGVDTQVPAVGLLPDDGIAGADGLTPTAAYVVGVDPSQASNLVPGLTDLAALQQGLVPAAAISGTQGVVGALGVTGAAQAIAVAGGPGASTQVLAYIGTSAGLSVVDVSRATRPVLLSELALTGGVSALAFDAQTGTVAAVTGTGLQLLDVSNPSAPLPGRALTLAATHVTTVAGVAYASVGGRVVSVDLATGIVLQRLTLGSQAIVDIVHNGTTLYAVDAGRTLTAITVTGGLMAVAGSVAVPYAGSLFAAGSTVLVGAATDTRNGGYSTVDVSNPASPAVIAGPSDRSIAGGNIALNGAGLGLADQVLNVTFPNTSNVLDVIGTADPTVTNRIVNRILLPGTPGGVAIAGGLGYVADGASGLQVVNLATPRAGTAAPVVTVTSGPTDVDPNTTGLQVYAGEPLSLAVQVASGAPIVSTQLLLNGQAVVNAVSFPYDLTTVLPALAAGSTATLQVRSTDTAGNTGLSQPITVQVLRDTSPLRLLSQSVGTGTIISTQPTTFSFTFSRPLDTTVTGAGAVFLAGPDGISITPTSFSYADGNRTLNFGFGALPVGNYSLAINDAAITDVNGVSYGATLEKLPFQVAVFDTAFTNPDGGSFDTGANWSTGHVPSATDAALVQLGRGTIVTFDSASIAPASLLIEGASLQVQSGSFTGTALQTGRGGEVVFTDRGSTLTGGSIGAGSTLDGQQQQPADGLWRHHRQRDGDAGVRRQLHGLAGERRHDAGRHRHGCARQRGLPCPGLRPGVADQRRDPVRRRADRRRRQSDLREHRHRGRVGGGPGARAGHQCGAGGEHGHPAFHRRRRAAAPRHGGDERRRHDPRLRHGACGPAIRCDHWGLAVHHGRGRRADRGPRQRADQWRHHAWQHRDGAEQHQPDPRGHVGQRGHVATGVSGQLHAACGVGRCHAGGRHGPAQRQLREPVHQQRHGGGADQHRHGPGRGAAGRRGRQPHPHEPRHDQRHGHEHVNDLHAREHTGECRAAGGDGRGRPATLSAYRWTTRRAAPCPAPRPERCWPPARARTWTCNPPPSLAAR